MNQQFQQVLNENEARLVRIARQYAGPNDWQDLLQEIAIALWKGLPSFAGRSSLSTWIYRVAVNTALQHVRKRPVATEALATEPMDSTDVDDPMALLERFLASLDPVNKALLLMDLEGLSRADIAEVLGISEGAVAVRMTRLKQHFSETFVEEA
ncbi:MAG: RNA polymerase sigma factor [Wenzhouxiangella sp.]